MYAIVAFLGRISQTIRLFFGGLTRPFEIFFFQLRAIGRYNPVTQLGSFFRSLNQQIRYYLRLPTTPKIGAPAAPQPVSLGESLRNLRDAITGRGRAFRRGRVKVAQRAQFSQIHLIHQLSGQRIVVHIGTVIGKSSAEIAVTREEHKQARLRFVQVDPQQRKVHIVMTYPVGTAVVQVDGAEIADPKQEVPLRHRSLIKIDNQAYTCELYAWDRAPIITRVTAGWATSPGPRREKNEDAVGIYQHRDAYLFAVADGVGSGKYGERVSEYAIRYLLEAFHKNVRYTKIRVPDDSKPRKRQNAQELARPRPPLPKPMPWANILQRAFQFMNAEVRLFAMHSATNEGSTLTSVVIQGWDAYVAHVGDSRLYHWHNNTLRQITTDHLQKTVTSTRVAVESPDPPMTEVLAKAIGKSDRIQPDIINLSLQPGDKLLVCSDGLPKVITREEITDYLRTTRAERLPEELVRLCNERNSADNISAIAIDVLEEPFADDTWQARSGDRVYVGHVSSGALKLRKPPEAMTQYAAPARVGWTRLIIVLLMIALVGYAGRLLFGGAGSVSGQGAEATVTSVTEPVGGADAVFTATNTPRPPATETPTPTETPFPTITETPTITPSPVTPTATLRPASSRNSGG